MTDQPRLDQAYEDKKQVQVPDMSVPRATTYSAFTAFVYQLLRDHISPGTLEGIVEAMEQGAAERSITHYGLSNGWLASYADNIAGRLAVVNQTLALERVKVDKTQAVKGKGNAVGGAEEPDQR